MGHPDTSRLPASFYPRHGSSQLLLSINSVDSSQASIDFPNIHPPATKQNCLRLRPTRCTSHWPLPSPSEEAPLGSPWSRLGLVLTVFSLISTPDHAWSHSFNDPLPKSFTCQTSVHPLRMYPPQPFSARPSAPLRPAPGGWVSRLLGLLASS